MTIPNLNTSDTFKTWFDRTNTVISEVNGITIHNLLAGDGIGVTSASNVFTVSHGSLVATGVTFTGPVNFTNTTSFNISPTIDATVVNVSPVVSGITIGNIVRVTENGLTLAKADTAANAEVLGIVVNRSGNNHVVALAGSVNNNIFNNTISNMLGVVGGTLSKGCAYFLSPEIAGGITTVEPVTYKQVSKPIILGITGNVGSIIPYRGIEIDGISAGITAELDNKIIIQIDYSDTTNGLTDFILTGNPVKPGDGVVLFSSNASDITEQAASINSAMTSSVNAFIWKIAGKLNNMSYHSCAIIDPSIGVLRSFVRTNEFLGLVSKVINHDTVNSIIILEITLPGGSFSVDVNELDAGVWPTINRSGGLVFDQQIGFLRYNQSSISGEGTNESEMFVNVISTDANNAIITLVPQNALFTPGQTTFIQNLITESIPESFGFTKDLLLNGKFTIKQRWYDTGTGRGPTMATWTDTQITKPFTPFVADRWFIVKPPEMSGVTFEWKLLRNGFPNLVIPDRQNYKSNPNNVTYRLQFNVQYVAPSASGYGNAFTPLKAPRLRLENIVLCPFELLGSKATLEFTAGATVAGSPSGSYCLKVMTNSYPLESTYSSRVAGPTGLSGDIYIRKHWSSKGFTTATSLAVDQNWIANSYNGGVTLTENSQTFQVPLLIGATETQYRTGAGSFDVFPFASVRSSKLNYRDNEWISVGFEFESNPNALVNIGNVRLLPGWKAAGIVEERTPEEEHYECKRYYQTSYYWDTPVRYAQNDATKPDSYYEKVQYPNPLVSSPIFIPFKREMRRVPFGVTLYSVSGVPSHNGITGEVFNVSTLTNTGTFPAEPLLQQKNLPWDLATLRLRPSEPIGQNFFATTIANNGFILESLPGGISEMGDYLHFHYVADADLSMPAQ
jgi:hypothetical protein